MNHKKKKIWQGMGSYLTAVLIGVIVIIPFLWMLSTSFKSKGALMQIPVQWIPKEPSLDAYRTVFSRFPLLRAIGNSFLITGSYTVVTILSASMAAFAITKIKFPWAEGIFKFYLASMMIPTQVTLIPLFVIMNRMGLINTYPSVILPSLFRAFAVFMLVQQMRSIPNDFMEAARIDGAGELRIFLTMGLPLGKSGLLSAMVLGFLEYWNLMEQPLAFLEEKALWPLSLYLPEISWLQAGFALCASFVTLIPAAFVFVLGQDYLEQGIVYSGLKE